VGRGPGYGVGRVSPPSAAPPRCSSDEARDRDRRKPPSGQPRTGPLSCPHAGPSGLGTSPVTPTPRFRVPPGPAKLAKNRSRHLGATPQAGRRHDRRSLPGRTFSLDELVIALDSRFQDFCCWETTPKSRLSKPRGLLAPRQGPWLSSSPSSPTSGFIPSGKRGCQPRAFDPGRPRPSTPTRRMTASPAAIGRPVGAVFTPPGSPTSRPGQVEPHDAGDSTTVTELNRRA